MAGLSLLSVPLLMSRTNQLQMVSVAVPSVNGTIGLLLSVCMYVRMYVCPMYVPCTCHIYNRCLPCLLSSPQCLLLAPPHPSPTATRFCSSLATTAYTMPPLMSCAVSTLFTIWCVFQSSNFGPKKSHLQGQQQPFSYKATARATLNTISQHNSTSFDTFTHNLQPLRSPNKEEISSVYDSHLLITPGVVGWAGGTPW